MKFTAPENRLSASRFAPLRMPRRFNAPVVAIALLACSLSLMGCSNTVGSAPSPAVEPTQTVSPSSATQPDTTQSTPVAQTPDAVGDVEPEVGIIREIQQGDLMCYITFTDESGQERRVGATFELCEQPETYLNQRVRLIYGVRNVSDCQSNEPCGKTRKANVVVQLDRVDDAGRPISSDSMVLKNGAWTIAVGNMNSWNGTNNTGNLSYRGCNSKQECLELTGGKMSCRDGLCGIGWNNGNYRYNLQFAIANPDQLSRSPATLIVSKDGKELQQIRNLRPASDDSMVLKNSAWTIAVGNMNSWNGTNNTGNLSYRGCNSKQECLELTGGKMSCRDGLCGIGWNNGNYRYNLQFAIANPDQPARSPATLIVSKDGKELQQIRNLR